MSTSEHPPRFRAASPSIPSSVLQVSRRASGERPPRAAANIPGSIPEASPEQPRQQPLSTLRVSPPITPASSRGALHEHPSSIPRASPEYLRHHPGEPLPSIPAKHLPSILGSILRASREASPVNPEQRLTGILEHLLSILGSIPSRIPRAFRAAAPTPCPTVPTAGPANFPAETAPWQLPGTGIARLWSWGATLPKLRSEWGLWVLGGGAHQGDTGHLLTSSLSQVCPPSSANPSAILHRVGLGFPF